MAAFRPITLSIAGLDPSAGAGLLADIKTFEEHRTYGLGLISANTIQTEDHFVSVRWETVDQIIAGLDVLMERYPVLALKIGIVENIHVLHRLVPYINDRYPAIKIVVDPVLRASSGFGFWTGDLPTALLSEVLGHLSLLTPNYQEMQELVPEHTAEQAAAILSYYCPILLKGGHNSTHPGTDFLYIQGEMQELPPEHTQIYAKHGSGCVLSAAITANLALGYELFEACQRAKHYTENFLLSNPSLSGYHHV